MLGKDGETHYKRLLLNNGKVTKTLQQLAKKY
jgi:hypothetical protein